MATEVQEGITIEGHEMRWDEDAETYRYLDPDTGGWAWIGEDELSGVLTGDIRLDDALARIRLDDRWWMGPWLWLLAVLPARRR